MHIDTCVFTLATQTCKHTVVDDSNDNDDVVDDTSESSAMLLLSSSSLCSKSLSDNRPSDTIASLNVFWSI